MFQKAGPQRGVNLAEEWKNMERGLNLGDEVEEDNNTSGEEDEDDHDDCRCSKWEVLDKLLSSHADLTRMFVNLWEEEKNRE